MANQAGSGGERRRVVDDLVREVLTGTQREVRDALGRVLRDPSLAAALRNELTAEDPFQAARRQPRPLTERAPIVQSARIELDPTAGTAWLLNEKTQAPSFFPAAGPPQLSDIRQVANGLIHAVNTIAQTKPHLVVASPRTAYVLQQFVEALASNPTVDPATNAQLRAFVGELPPIGDTETHARTFRPSISDVVLSLRDTPIANTAFLTEINLKEIAPFDGGAPWMGREMPFRFDGDEAREARAFATMLAEHTVFLGPPLALDTHSRGGAGVAD